MNCDNNDIAPTTPHQSLLRIPRSGGPVRADHPIWRTTRPVELPIIEAEGAPCVPEQGDETMTQATQGQGSYPPEAGYGSTTRTGWTGWITFAGVLMVIGGLLNAFYGLVAVVNDEWVVWTNRTAVYLDITQWGWVHIVLGLVVVLAGIGVFSGNVLARTVGVIVASLSLIANFFFIPAYPLWAITVIVIDVLVIWALTAHGGEMRNP